MQKCHVDQNCDIKAANIDPTSLPRIPSKNSPQVDALFAVTRISQSMRCPIKAEPKPDLLTKASVDQKTKHKHDPTNHKQARHKSNHNQKPSQHPLIHKYHLPQTNSAKSNQPQTKPNQPQTKSHQNPSNHTQTTNIIQPTTNIIPSTRNTTKTKTNQQKQHTNNI